MGDVGALQSTLAIIFNTILVHHCQIGILLDNHLINGIFRKRDDVLKTKRFKITFLEWLKQIPYELVPRCRPFKRNKATLIRRVGIRRIERELDIVHFMRKQFAFTALYRALTSKVQRGLARRQFSLIVGEKQDAAVTTESSESDYNFPGVVEETEFNSKLIAQLRKANYKEAPPDELLEISELSDHSIG